MTKLELLEKLDREATSGPWDFSEAYGVAHIDNNDKGGFGIASIVEDVSDADLICKMRNALPDLLAVVRAAHTHFTEDVVESKYFNPKYFKSYTAVKEALAKLNGKQE